MCILIIRQHRCRIVAETPLLLRFVVDLLCNVLFTTSPHHIETLWMHPAKAVEQNVRLHFSDSIYRQLCPVKGEVCRI